ncbi:MAG: NAD(P)H-dependent oxidoreductase subunit E [Sulfobacillus sp.]
MISWWGLAALDVVALSLFAWRGYKIVTDRRASMIVGMATIAGLLLDVALPPAGIAVGGWELGVVAAYVWSWSDQGQMTVIIGGGLILGILAYLGHYWIFPFAAFGILSHVAIRSLWVRQPEFEARAMSGKIRPYKYHAVLCYGDACQLRGAEVLREAVMALPQWKAGQGVRVTTSDCLGYCQKGPVVWIEPQGHLCTLVRPKDLPRLFENA